MIASLKADSFILSKEMGKRRIKTQLRKPKPHVSPFVLLFLLLLPIPILLLHLSSSVFRRANSLGRRCYPYATQYSMGDSATKPLLKIAMVSFSDEDDDERAERKRSFKGLTELVGANKRSYAEKLGYNCVDARDLVDHSRPPSWSKILAVRFYLRAYDWVFWNDADTLVGNPEIPLEYILKAAIGHLDFYASQDLVVTEDKNGINAGVFFVRRSKWSEDFLDKWWNQTSFIRFGSTKSGDNAAMKHLIDGLMPEDRQVHIRISPMQCLFNSYPWNPTWKSVYNLISSPQAIWKGTYSKGDFMVHLAGFDSKREWAVKMLQEIKGER